MNDIKGRRMSVDSKDVDVMWRWVAKVYLG